MGRLFFLADNVPPDMTAIEFALTPQAFPYFFGEIKWQVAFERSDEHAG